MTNKICHGKVTARPTVVQCTGYYEKVNHKSCIVCEREAKEKFPGKSMKEIRKEKNSSGHNIIKYVRRGCQNCNVAVCKDHWDIYQH